MPRLPRDRGPGYFHVTTRGNDGADVFLTGDDRRVFLFLLGRNVRELDWVLHAWCLMTNHFHLVVEVPQPSLSDGMARLNGVYAQWFNGCHGRTGHVFGRRFWSKRVEGDRQLRDVGLYVLHNPVRAGLCSDPLDWRWLGGTLIREPAAPVAVG